MSFGSGGSLGTAVLELSTDSSKLESGLRDAERKTQKSTQSMGKSISDMGRGMADAGKKMTMGVTLPIVGVGAAALKMGADFQTSMNQVNALTGASEKEFKQLEDQAKELGRTTQFSASQSADAMGFLAMAGFEANEILGAMPGTLQLAAAANMELADAADTVSNILTGYGMEVEDLSRVNDVLVKTMTSANVDLSMLGESMKFVGPVASATGVQFEEAAAAIGLLGNAGIQGSMAGTSLRGAISRLINPTDGAATLLNELGIKTMDASGEFVGLTSIIEQLEDSGADTADMMSLFGDRAGPAMASLVEQGSGSLKELIEELENSGGTAEEIAAVQMEGLNGAIKALQSAFEGLMIAIAETGLIDWAADLVVGVTGLIQKVTEINPVFLRWGVIIAGIVAAIGPALLVLGYLTMAFGAMLSPIGLVIAAVAGLVAIFATDFMGIRTAVVDVFESVMSRIGGIQDAITTFRQALSGDWSDDADIMPLHRAFGFIGTAIRNVIDVGRSFLDLIQALRSGNRMDIFRAIMDLPLVFRPVGRIVWRVAEQIRGLWSAFSAGDSILGRISNVLGELFGPETVARFWAAVFIFQELRNTLRERLAPAFELIRDNLDLLLGPFGAIVATIRGVVEGFGEDGFTGAIRGGASALGEFVGRMIEFARDLGAILLPILRDAGTALYEWIAPMVGPALERLREFIGSVISWITDTAVPWLVDRAKELGSALIGWIAENVPPALDALWGFITEIAGWITDTAVPHLTERATELASAFWGWISEAVPEALESLGEFLSEVGSWIRDTAVPYLTEQATGLASSLWEWISEAVPEALSRLGAFLTSIRDWFIEDGIDSIDETIRSGASALADAIAGLFESGAAEGSAKAGPGILAAIGYVAYKFIEWVAPLVTPLLEAVGGLLYDLGEWIVTTAAPAIGEKLTEWGIAFWGWVAEVVPPLLEALGGLLYDLGEWIVTTAVPAIAEKLWEWGVAFAEWADEAIPPMLQALGGLLYDLGEWIVTTAVPEIVSKLIEWGTAFAEWADEAIPPMIRKLGGLLYDLGEWIVTTAVPEIAKKLAEWAVAFAHWADEAIPPMIRKLGGLLYDLGEWIVTAAVPEIAKKLAEWSVAFAHWADEAIPPMLRELGGLLVDLGKWIVNDAAPEIGKKLVQWGTAFWEWVSEAVPKMLRELGSLLVDLGGWIIDTALPEIGTKLAEWTKAFWEWVSEAVPDLLSALGSLLVDIGKWAIDDGIPYLWDIGTDLATSMIDAILEWLSDTKESVQDALSGPFEWFRDVFSWSTVTSAATDAWDAINTFIDKAKTAMQNVLKAPFEWFRDTFGWDSIKSAATDIWDEIKKHIDNGRQAMEDALKAPFEWLRENVGGIMARAGTFALRPLKAIIDGFNTMGRAVVRGLSWIGEQLNIEALESLSWTDRGTSFTSEIADPRTGGMGGGRPHDHGEANVAGFTIPATTAADPEAMQAIQMGIDGPMDDMGRGGFVDFVKNTVGDVADWVSDIPSSVIDFVKRGASWIHEQVLDRFPFDWELPGVMSGLGTRVVELIRTGLMDSIRDAIKPIEDEIAAQEAAALQVIDGTYSGGLAGWVRPTTGVITQLFGQNLVPGFYGPAGHTGVDIANAIGTPIRAANNGLVVQSGWNGGYGNAITIKHNGLSTLYGHMSSLNVSAGQTVSAGQVIGLMGSTGMSTGPHLHLEVINASGQRINPAGIVPFAKGGLIDEPTLALMGEAGPELVLPLSGYGSKWAPGGATADGAGWGVVKDIVDKYTRQAIMQILEEEGTGAWTSDVGALLSGQLIEQLEQTLAETEQYLEFAIAAGWPPAVIAALEAERDETADQIEAVMADMGLAMAAGLLDPAVARQMRWATLDLLDDGVLDQVHNLIDVMPSEGRNLVDAVIKGMERGEWDLDQAAQMLPDTVIPHLEELEQKLVVDLAEAFLTGTDPALIEENLGIITALLNGLGTTVETTATRVLQATGSNRGDLTGSRPGGGGTGSGTSGAGGGMPSGGFGGLGTAGSFGAMLDQEIKRAQEGFSDASGFFPRELMGSGPLEAALRRNLEQIGGLDALNEIMEPFQSTLRPGVSPQHDITNRLGQGFLHMLRPGRFYAMLHQGSFNVHAGFSNLTDLFAWLAGSHPAGLGRNLGAFSALADALNLGDAMDSQRFDQRMARGGVIREPVAGLGLRTGTSYLMGEDGDEAVVPLNGKRGGMQVQQNYNINGVHPDDVRRNVDRAMRQTAVNWGVA